jgi:hypothetical protein
MTCLRSADIGGRDTVHQFRPSGGGRSAQPLDRNIERRREPSAAGRVQLKFKYAFKIQETKWNIR